MQSVGKFVELLKREKCQLIRWPLLVILYCACFKFDLSYSH